MKQLLFAIWVAVVLCGCAAAKCEKGGELGANDGYVPWWVEEKVPNAAGVVVGE